MKVQDLITQLQEFDPNSIVGQIESDTTEEDFPEKLDGMKIQYRRLEYQLQIIENGSLNLLDIPTINPCSCCCNEEFKSIGCLGCHPLNGPGLQGFIYDGSLE